MAWISLSKTPSPPSPHPHSSHAEAKERHRRGIGGVKEAEGKLKGGRWLRGLQGPGGAFNSDTRLSTMINEYMSTPNLNLMPSTYTWQSSPLAFAFFLTKLSSFQSCGCKLLMRPKPVEGLHKSDHWR